MIKKLFLAVAILSILGITIYMIFPEPKYPSPLPDSVQSMEKADTEDPMRRAYFTNYTREQVIAHYKNQFRYQPFILRLNYPPEESQTIIRDQTRSTYLEELVHPLRESMFINGFEPRVPKDDIWYKGIHYQEKVIVKYVPTSVFVRLPIAVASLAALFFVVWQFVFKNGGKNNK